MCISCETTVLRKELEKPHHTYQPSYSVCGQGVGISNDGDGFRLGLNISSIQAQLILSADQRP